MSNVSDPGSFLDPEASRDYLRSWRDDAERRAERAAAMAARIEQVRTSAKDGNNLAEVTVDSGGVLIDLVLTDRIHRVDPATVAQAVLGALRKARAGAAEQAQAIAVETMGANSLSAQVIGDRMRQQLDRPEPGTASRSGEDRYRG
ncbi:YbaB/EbfC family nucleoid-associated protein [Actinoplanes couchii]|uniref:YbaB/EbfC DNA-binding family protein n=1 Tax=Actinoplanes couchii TaxID=403638 RepID=A0ABQ3XEJ5_9ACTN|nr:YbaB/EbfC family nucleoid-associated protein [Actinoplanes couchii]MDR6319777.1 DNA-binding protein YbaB [Actinoplanes couchii]GID56912.1 hypothetical protein Aco03nite_053160 [Actinoplanes couchii]